MALFEEVRDVIVKELGVAESKVTESATYQGDLGADSLDVVELVMAFEEKFDIEIPEEDAEKIQTVGETVKYISEKMES